MIKQTLILLLCLASLLAITLSCEKTNPENRENNSTKTKNVKLTPRSAIDDCFDNSGCMQIQDSAVQLISVSGYSPCQVYAVYDLWACYSLGGVLVKYSITNFSVGLISNGCDSLIDRWDSIENTAHDYTQLNYEMDLFYAAAKTSLERYIMGQFFASSAHRDSFPCTGGSYGVLTTETYTALCYKWCQIDLGGTPPISVLTQIICGDACCIKEVEWCWNTSNNTVHFGDPSFGTTGSCDSSPSSMCSGTTRNGDCDDHTCEP